MKLFIFAIACLLNFISTPTMAGFDIRNTPLPSPSNTIKTFGYSAAINAAMLANPAHPNWGARPLSGWTNSTVALFDRMRHAINSGYGISSNLAIATINKCKIFARDPSHCAIYASAVMCAESTCGNISGTGIFGVQISPPPTKIDAIHLWVATYNKKWYVANEGYHYGFCKVPNPIGGYMQYCDRFGNDFSTKFFYSNNAKLRPFSEYCLSEAGSGNYCPNGFKNSNAAYLRVK